MYRIDGLVEHARCDVMFLFEEAHEELLVEALSDAVRGNPLEASLGALVLGHALRSAFLLTHTHGRPEADICVVLMLVRQGAALACGMDGSTTSFWDILVMCTGFLGTGADTALVVRLAMVLLEEVEEKKRSSGLSTVGWENLRGRMMGRGTSEVPLVGGKVVLDGHLPSILGMESVHGPALSRGWAFMPLDSHTSTAAMVK